MACGTPEGMVILTIKNQPGSSEIEVFGGSRNAAAFLLAMQSPSVNDGAIRPSTDLQIRECSREAGHPRQ
jgi:hypothetical protein